MQDLFAKPYALKLVYIATNDSDDIEYEERHRRRMQMIAISDALDAPGAGENRMSLFSTGRRRTSSDLLSGGSSSNESGPMSGQPTMPNIYHVRNRQSLTGLLGIPRVNSMQRAQGAVHHAGNYMAATTGGDIHNDIESSGSLGPIYHRVQALELRVTNVEKRIGFFSADESILEGDKSTSDKKREKQV